MVPSLLLEQLGKKRGLTRVGTLKGKQIWRRRDMITEEILNFEAYRMSR